MSDLFFNGCESWMSEEEVDNKDDNQLDVHQETGDKIATVEEQAEHVLTVEAEAEAAADSVAQIDAEMRAYDHIFEKYAELDRMIAYIKNYGIDQSFLSLCNKNNILGQSFGIKFAVLESYDLKGNPNSPEAIAALEGLGTAVRTVWEFIKRTIARLLDWISRILSFRDLCVKMYKHSIESLKKRAKDIKNWSVPASEDVIADPATVTKLIEKLKQLSVREDAENIQNLKDVQMTKTIDQIEAERDSWTSGVVADELAHHHCSLVEVNHILDNASEALVGLDKCFNSLPQLRKALSEIRIEASRNGGDANAIKEKIDNAKLAIRRANRRIYSFLDICGQSIKNARTCIKLAEENNKAGTESFY